MAYYWSTDYWSTDYWSEGYWSGEEAPVVTETKTWSGGGLYISIEMGMGGGGGGIGSLVLSTAEASFDTWNKTATGVLTITPTLTSASASDTTVTVTFSGGHSDQEDYGVGKHFTLALAGGAGAGESITNTAYNTTVVTCVIAAGNTTRVMTMTIANNPVLELDRVIDIICPLFGTKSITIVDDNVVETINVSAPGHSLDALTGDGVTDDSTALQAIYDYIAGEGTDHIVYFPAGTYRLLQLTPTWGITNVGQSKAGTTIKKVDSRSIGTCTITKATGIVALPAGHGLSNGHVIYFEDVVEVSWADIEDYGYVVSDLSGNNCRIKNTGTHPNTGSYVDMSGFTAATTAATVLQQYADHHMFNSTTYSVDGTDSAALSFMNMTIHGNSLNSGPWQYYEAEHSSSIFPGATGTGFLKCVVENVHFQDLLAPAIHPYAQSDCELYHLTQENGNIGGLCATSCQVAADTVKVNAVDLVGTATRAGEYPEFHVENITGGCTITGDRINLGEGNFHITVYQSNINSTVTLTNCDGNVAAMWARPTAGTAVISLSGTTAGSITQSESLAGKLYVSGNGSSATLKNALLDDVAYVDAINSGLCVFDSCQGVCNTTKLYSTTSYYALPYVNTLTSAGHVKYLNCTPTVESDVPVGDRAVVVSQAGQDLTGKIEVDNSAGGTDFDYLVKRDTPGAGGGQGCNLILKNMTVNETCMLKWQATAAYKCVLDMDTITIGADCLYFWNLTNQATAGECLRLNRTSVEVNHHLCKLHSYFNLETDTITVTGAMNINSSVAPAAGYPDGFNGDTCVYDETTYTMGDGAGKSISQYGSNIASPTEQNTGAWAE